MKSCFPLQTTFLRQHILVAPLFPAGLRIWRSSPCSTQGRAMFNVVGAQNARNIRLHRLNYWYIWVKRFLAVISLVTGLLQLSKCHYYELMTSSQLTRFILHPLISVQCIQVFLPTLFFHVEIFHSKIYVILIYNHTMSALIKTTTIKLLFFLGTLVIRIEMKQ